MPIWATLPWEHGQAEMGSCVFSLSELERLIAPARESCCDDSRKVTQWAFSEHLLNAWLWTVNTAQPSLGDDWETGVDGQIDIHYWYPQLRLSHGGHMVQRKQAQGGTRGGQEHSKQGAWTMSLRSSLGWRPVFCVNLEVALDAQKTGSTLFLDVCEGVCRGD